MDLAKLSHSSAVILCRLWKFLHLTAQTGKSRDQNANGSLGEQVRRHAPFDFRVVTFTILYLLLEYIAITALLGK